jgi:hypothetical protein
LPVEGSVEARPILFGHICDVVQEVAESEVAVGGGLPRFECAKKPSGVFELVPMLDDLFQGILALALTPQVEPV